MFSDETGSLNHCDNDKHLKSVSLERKLFISVVNIAMISFECCALICATRQIFWFLAADCELPGSHFYDPQKWNLIMQKNIFSAMNFNTSTFP